MCFEVVAWAGALKPREGVGFKKRPGEDLVEIQSHKDLNTSGEIYLAKLYTAFTTLR